MAQIRVEDYLRLIAQQAWITWRKLPAHTRVWIGIDDLIQEGVVFARVKLLPKYNPKLSQFQTYLIASLQNYYKEYFLSWNYRQRRDESKLCSLGAVQYSVGELDRIEQELHAVEALKKILAEASPVLQHYLNHWLVVRGHMHFRGERFQTARFEFRQLSSRYHFHREDFEFLLRHESWRYAVTIRR